MIKSIKNEIRKNSVYSKKSTNNNDNQNKRCIKKFKF